MAGLLMILFVYIPLGFILFNIALYAMALLPTPQKVHQYIEFAARSLAYVLSLIACAFYGIISACVLRALGHPGLASWPCAKSFEFVMSYTCDVRFEIVEGEEHLRERPAVFISNHQSELDVLMLGTVWPKYCSVTAKSTLKSYPFLGQFMSVSGAVFIDRGNRTNAFAAFDNAANIMKTQKQSVFIFPEGTRSYTREPMLLPFKKGAFHLAVKAQVDIVPIVVANYSNVIYLQGRWFRPGRIPIKVLPPISTKNMDPSQVEDLTRSVRGTMLQELIALSVRSSTSPIEDQRAVKASGIQSELQGGVIKSRKDL